MDSFPSLPEVAAAGLALMLAVENFPQLGAKRCVYLWHTDTNLIFLLSRTVK